MNLPRLCILAVLVGCADRAPPALTPVPRPVTVIELREVDPVKPLQLTGSAKSWKEESVAFEIEGRVEFIVEAGTNLRGRWVEKTPTPDPTAPQFRVIVPGDVLGRIDPRSFEIQRDQAMADVRVAEDQLQTGIVELEKVLPANQRAAEADRDRAQAEFDRYEAAFEKKAVAEVDVIRARADRDASQAHVDQAEARIEGKKAEVAALRANIDAAKERLNQAQYDVDRCKLYAPFEGEVSEVMVEAGGYARRGQAVAHLVMMNPIKIDLALSAATAERLKLGEVVSIFLPGDKEPSPAIVYDKATTADAETRTFRVSLLTRNIRTIDLPPDDPRRKQPVISRYQFLFEREDGAGYMVEENRSLHEQNGGYYVWAAADVRMGDDIDGRTVTLKQFAVTPGTLRRNYQGIYLMRQLTGIGDLEQGMLVAMDVPEDFPDGGQALVATPDWRLRPGQLVAVVLSATVPQPGLYLPMDAIRPIDQKSGLIFLAMDGKAREVKVKMVSNIGSFFRIAAVNAQDAPLIKPGAQVITDFIHFLEDGELVHVVKTADRLP